MTPESRIPQAPGTRGVVKSSKPLASAVSASAPALKRHSPGPKLSSTKGTIAKSPSSSSSSSSSDSSTGKKCLNGGNAIAKETTKESAAKILPSESAAETAGKEHLSFECVEPDESNRITDMAEPSLETPGMHVEDVVDSSLAASSCFTLESFQVFDDHVTTAPTSHTIVSEVAAVTADDFGAEDVSEGFLNGSTVAKQADETGAFFNLMREGAQGIDAVWRALCVPELLFAASAVSLWTVWLCVEILMEDELDWLPPPT